MTLNITTMCSKIGKDGKRLTEEEVLDASAVKKGDEFVVKSVEASFVKNRFFLDIELESK